MRLAVVKPDWGITGGYEVMLTRLERGLLDRGHLVERYTVDAWPGRQRLLDLDIPPSVWGRAPEFFRYVALGQQVAAMELPSHRFDAVLSTQPPSWAVRHPRQVSLFSHHERIFYDLADAATEAGIVDAGSHPDAAAAVRAMDDRWFAGVTQFLAASRTVADRLATYNGIIDRVSVFQPGPGLRPTTGPGASQSSSDRGPIALCVSRHEFAKRTELFVHALKYLPERLGVAAGGGGRLERLRALDVALSDPTIDLDAVGAEDLWLCPNSTPEAATFARSNVEILGPVADADLRALFGRARCVVLPALGEDYGMTAVEAMQAGLPCIACDDGGGLLELVRHEETGLVVEPTGAAIAAAIERLFQDPDEAKRLGEAGREAASSITWARAVDTVVDALEGVMAR